MTPNQDLLLETLSTGDMNKLTPEQNQHLSLLMLKVLAEIPLSHEEWHVICIAITITVDPRTLKNPLEVTTAMLEYLSPTPINN